MDESPRHKADGGRWHNRLRRLRFRYARFTHHFSVAIRNISGDSEFISTIAAACCLIILVIYFGYDNSEATLMLHRRLLRIIQGIFVFNVGFNLIFNLRATLRATRTLKWIVDIAVLLTLLPWIYPHPVHPWLPFLEKILYSNVFLFGILTAYSIVRLSYGVMKLIGRRTNPALILSGSFLFFIIAGSFVLMLPRCTVVPLSYIDSLFVSTSAVCITGLTSVDVPSTFTPLGLLVLAILIQIGGLGVITFTSFFAIFFSGVPSIYSQLLIRDIVYSKSMNNLVPTLLYILVFTLAVEVAGAVAVYLTIPDALGLDVEHKMTFAAFHALSSFCNAGFSCLPGGMANPILLHGAQSIYWVTSLLILAGAIGFPILVNLKDIATSYIRRLFIRAKGLRQGNRAIHIYDLNTKLVIITTLAILALSTIAFMVFEYNNTLAGMTFGEKVSQSVFNSLVPRSAGFMSVNPAAFMPVTLLLIIAQMWIGGASQSLAGGIKVNTVAVVLLNLRSVIRGHRSAVAFNRRIAIGSVRRANAVIIIAIIAFFLYTTAILLLEPQMASRDIIFEVTSALFTVGSSLGITADLCDLSKIVLSTAMFIGRVGILSMLIGFAAGSADRSAHYPVDNIIIN